MLKVSKQILTKTGKYTGVTLHSEGKDSVELFENMAKLQEVFSDTYAQKGDKFGNDVVFRVRDVGGNKFYELFCPSLKAKLPFGVSKERPGDLYPKRTKMEDGKVAKDENDRTVYLPDRGWRVWNNETQQEE